MTRLRLVLVGAVLAAAAAFPTVAAAATTINPANGPNGTHFKSGSASCSTSSNGVTCTGFTLAGVGNTNATATLTAVYTGTVVCINGGGNPSDSQHQGAFTVSVPSGTLQSKNGNLTVPSLTSTAPNERQFLAQQTCPNPNWTPTLSGPITLQSFTYNLQFAGFSGSYITITGP
jgi:hypothetical protein